MNCTVEKKEIFDINKRLYQKAQKSVMIQSFFRLRIISIFTLIFTRRV